MVSHSCRGLGLNISFDLFFSILSSTFPSRRIVYRSMPYPYLLPNDQVPSSPGAQRMSMPVLVARATEKIFDKNILASAFIGAGNFGPAVFDAGFFVPG